MEGCHSVVTNFVTAIKLVYVSTNSAHDKSSRI